MGRLLLIFCVLISITVSACHPENARSLGDVDDLAWDEIEAMSAGSRVHMMMWMGDPYINAYMRGYVVPELAKRHGIDLTIGSGQGGQIVSMLMTEMEADAEVSGADIVWINGETFYQLRQIGALYGPFTDRLPNAVYVDFDDPFIGSDFQLDIAGYESPWGTVQFVMIYDSVRVPEPPRSMAALEKWLHSHPGRFTFDSSFSGMTLLKSWLIGIAGGPSTLSGAFNESAYRKYSSELWSWIDRNRHYFWKQGDTFPASLSQVHRLFVGGEIDFTMSNNDGEVDNKVLQGFFPATTRAFAIEGGTIRNSHYVGIPERAPNKAGALVVANFLLSPAAQLRKLDPAVWGDGTVLDVTRLPDSVRLRFDRLPRRLYAPGRRELDSLALPELDAAYMTRLYDDFRTRIIER